MNRRTYLLGVGSLAAGDAATIGLGAFTSVEADCDVTVEVADDANAFLALKPEDKNGEYAQGTGSTLELNFDDNADVAGS